MTFIRPRPFAVLLVLAALCVHAPFAFAGPIPAAPLGAPPVAGESELTTFIAIAAPSDVTIDWMVIPYAGGLGPPPGGFLYLYQIENTSAVDVDAITLTMPAGATATILAAGVISGDDLDALTAFHPAHAEVVAPTDDAVPGPFPGLAGEEGPFPLAALALVLTTIDPVSDNLTWSFAPLLSGLESDTLAFVSTQPPTYGNAVAQNSTPPSPWGSLAPGGEPLPVPIPEPATAWLALLGLLAIAGVCRKSRR